jgi:hypothetical protein
MPNKVPLQKFYNDTFTDHRTKTTIQVNNFYRGNITELDLEKVAASAPKRSPTPEAIVEGWKDSKFPGSGIMSPVVGAAEAVTEGVSHMDIDRLPPNGHTGPTFASGASGDLPGTLDRHSGLTEPAQQLVKSEEPSQQQQQYHPSQKQLHFSRFVPSQQSASASNLPVNQNPTPPPFVVPSSPASSYPNYPGLHYPNHQARVVNRHGPLVFREQTGVRPSSSGTSRITGGHNSLKPISDSLGNPITHAANTISSWSIPPPWEDPPISDPSTQSTTITVDKNLPRSLPPPGTSPSEEYNTSRFYADR